MKFNQLSPTQKVRFLHRISWIFLLITSIFGPMTQENYNDISTLLGLIWLVFFNVLFVTVVLFVTMKIKGTWVSKPKKTTRINENNSMGYKIVENNQIRCFNCKNFYQYGSSYCPNCGMPSQSICCEISDVVVTLSNLTIINQKNNDFTSNMDCIHFTFCYLPKIKNLCSYSHFVSNEMKKILYRDISKYCAENFKDSFENTEEYIDIKKSIDKNISQIQKNYSNGKISRRQYDDLIAKNIKIINDFYQENINKHFPEQMIDGIVRVVYKENNIYEKVFEEETQLAIRNLIESESINVQKRLKELHNSSILQTKEYCRFDEQLKHYDKIYDETTKNYVDSILIKMRRKSKIVIDSSSNNNLISYDGLDDLDGWAFEEWCADVLKANGFINVEVTTKCGDNGADVLAEKDDITYAIQCKKYEGTVGVSAVQEVNTSKGMYNRDIAVVMTNSTFTPQAKKLAQSVNVKLWDGDKVQEMSKKLS